MASLYIYELSIQSSYTQNEELQASEHSFDTVQWWIDDDVTFRIRTYDLDSDIHIQVVGKALAVLEIDKLMRSRYSDILVGRYDFPSIKLEDEAKILAKMQSGTLDVSRDGRFAFWNHSDKKYTSKSQPQ